METSRRQGGQNLRFQLVGTRLNSHDQVVLDLMTELKDSVYLGLHSQCHCPTIYEFALTSVKDKLLEASDFG